jgi:Spy/CpxP family protein refolding chaperone
MKRIVKTALIAVAAAAMVFLPQNAIAQGRGGQRGQGGQGGPGGRGNFDPAQMRARMMERFQEQLGASADEWKVIQPLLEDVMTKQRAASGSRFGGMGMMFRGPRPGGQGAAPGAAQGGGQNRRLGRGEPNPAVEGLQKAIENKSTSSAELKAKLKALRDSRAQAAAELKAAQEKLQAVLTLRQEAQLVMMGSLE